ncbi:hypothetical protein AAHE18_13G129200 [Arachis hypogaea]
MLIFYCHILLIAKSHRSPSAPQPSPIFSSSPSLCSSQSPTSHCQRPSRCHSFPPHRHCARREAPPATVSAPAAATLLFFTVSVLVVKPASVFVVKNAYVLAISLCLSMCRAHPCRRGLIAVFLCRRELFNLQ